VHNEEDIIQIIAQASLSFRITTDMLQVDEAISQIPLKYLVQAQLVLAKIPTKALYKLQVSVAQEVQSQARTNTTKL
jgi:vacuolar-type H+-ATPase subunit I/STV1